MGFELIIISNFIEKLIIRYFNIEFGEGGTRRKHSLGIVRYAQN